MSYSCGYFKNAEDTLYDAQVNKADHILEKLQLQEGMTLLDIGCGWGFLLMRTPQKYGIKTGITLSKEQYQKFSEDIEREGLKDCLQVELMDYRDLKHSGAQFDRVVSVGMLEHVGRGNYELFMENAEAVLKPEGLFLLHYISAQKEHEGDPWIKKYIFPGGTIPSLREIIDILPEYEFHVLDIESLRRREPCFAGRRISSTGEIAPECRERIYRVRNFTWLPAQRHLIMELSICTRSWSQKESTTDCR